MTARFEALSFKGRVWVGMVSREKRDGDSNTIPSPALPLKGREQECVVEMGVMPPPPIFPQRSNAHS